MLSWPNDDWTRVEVFRLVYGHLPTHTSDTITRQTLQSFRAGVAAGTISSKSMNVKEIAEQIRLGRFFTSSRYGRMIRARKEE